MVPSHEAHIHWYLKTLLWKYRYCRCDDGLFTKATNLQIPRDAAVPLCLFLFATPCTACLPACLLSSLFAVETDLKGLAPFRWPAGQSQETRVSHGSPTAPVTWSVGLNGLVKGGLDTTPKNRPLLVPFIHGQTCGGYTQNQWPTQVGAADRCALHAHTHINYLL